MGGREGGREGDREGGREGGRSVWRNHHLLSLPSLSHPKAWQLYCQERACLPKAVTLSGIEWLPIYAGGRRRREKKKVQNSKVLRCVQNKARVLLRVEWLSFYAEEKKKKREKNQVQNSKFLRYVQNKARVLRRVEWLPFYEEKKKKKKKKNPSPKVQGFYAA